MIPNADMIERWSKETDDGYVIPASGWNELLWVLRQAEKVEDLTAAARELSEAHERRAKTAIHWTISEQTALAKIRMLLDKLDQPRSFAA